MIQDTNKSIWLEFLSSVAYHPHNKFMSYVRGKNIDYIPYVISALLNLQPPRVCGIQNRMSHMIIEQVYQIMNN